MLMKDEAQTSKKTMFCAHSKSFATEYEQSTENTVFYVVVFFLIVNLVLMFAVQQLTHSTH